MRTRRGLAVAIFALAGVCLFGAAAEARAGVIEYGNENVLNTGATYPSDPKAGAALQGLAAGVVTDATLTVDPHPFPFSPAVGDFPGTDQMYTGSVLTFADDGYAASPLHLSGPLVLTLDYNSLVPAGQKVTSLTLGLAADDFQFPRFGEPFSATVNGQSTAALTAKLNSLNSIGTGPAVHFFTIGLDPSLLLPSNVLTVSINEGGNGGDGFAVDFATVGVTTAPLAVTGSVPEPSTLALLVLGGGALAGWRWKRWDRPTG